MIDKVIPLDSPSARLMAEFLRLLTRKNLVIWQLADAEEPEAGFCADLNLNSDCDLAIRVKGEEAYRPRIKIPDLAISVNREEHGFTASIMWDTDEEAPLQPTAEEGGAELHQPDEITAAIGAELYGEVEKAYCDAEKVSG